MHCTFVSTKPQASLLASLLLASSVSLLTAQTVSTTPVGYRTDTIPAGNIPYAPSFVHADTFNGQISSLSEAGGLTTVTFTESTLTATALDEGTFYPAYYLEVTETGAYEGYSFDIISNTASTVTVSGLLSSGFGLSSSQTLAGTESVAIRKHMTVGDIFSDATSALTAYSDTVKFFNDDNTITLLYWDGTMWTPDFSANHTNKPIYPGEGFLTSFAGSVSLTTNGHVKTTKTKVPVKAGLVNLVGSLAPSDTTVDGLNAVSALVPYSDSVRVVSQDGNFTTQKTYYTDGSQMTTNFTGNDGSDVLQGHNSALFSAGSNTYITLPAAFTP